MLDDLAICQWEPIGEVLANLADTKSDCQFNHAQSLQFHQM